MGLLANGGGDAEDQRLHRAMAATPSKAAEWNSMGYDPYDLFDLGEFNQNGRTETWFCSRPKAFEGNRPVPWWSRRFRPGSGGGPYGIRAALFRRRSLADRRS